MFSLRRFYILLERVLNIGIDSGFFKDIRSGSNDKRFVEPIDVVSPFFLPPSPPLSLFFSIFLLARDLIPPCLDGESSRGVESTRRDRVFQAGCRLPPPWINTRIARATSLSLSLAQPLLLSAPLFLVLLLARPPRTLSCSSKLALLSLSLSHTLLYLLLFIFFLALFHFLSFSFVHFPIFSLCLLIASLLSFLFYFFTLFSFFFLVIVLSFFPISQSFSIFSSMWRSADFSICLSSLSSIDSFVFISHIAPSLFSPKQEGSRGSVRQPSRESNVYEMKDRKLLALGGSDNPHEARGKTVEKHIYVRKATHIVAAAKLTSFLSNFFSRMWKYEMLLTESTRSRICRSVGQVPQRPLEPSFHAYTQAYEHLSFLR